MAQTNVDYSQNPSGASLMDDFLAKMQANIRTCNSGVTRPEYAREGTVWLDTKSKPYVYKIFDGAKDLIIGKLENDKFVPANIEWGRIVGTLSAQTDLQNALNAKQNVGNYQLTTNISQSIDTSTTKYPSNKAVKTVVDTKANDSAVVHKTGDETIDGYKSFKQNVYVSRPLSGGATRYGIKDSNNKGSVSLDAYYTGNTIYARMLAENRTNKKSAYIDIQNRDNGDVILSATNLTHTQGIPNPSPTANGSEIATTAWVNGKGYATTSALNGKQSIANLSQTLDTSTTKYPSNKAVKDYFGASQGYSKTEVDNLFKALPKHVVVSTAPANPDANTFYYVKV